MCGIVGVVADPLTGFTGLHLSLFEELLYMDAFRGIDGTGIFAVEKDTGDLDAVKIGTYPSALFRTSQYDSIMTSTYNKGRILVGHNRKATVGSITNETAHPFIEDHICLVHNGYLEDAKTHAQTDVDSHAIAVLLAKADGDVSELISGLGGAFALVWWNGKTNKLHFIRNKERPLAIGISKYNKSFVFASESSMLRYALSRQNMAYDVSEVPVETLYTYDLKTGELETQGGVSFKQKKEPTWSVGGGNTSTGSTYHGTATDDDEEPSKKFSIGDPVVFYPLRTEEGYHQGFQINTLVGSVWNDERAMVKSVAFSASEMCLLAGAAEHFAIEATIDRVMGPDEQGDYTLFAIPGKLNPLHADEFKKKTTPPKTSDKWWSRNGTYLDDFIKRFIDDCNCDRCGKSMAFTQPEEWFIKLKMGAKPKDTDIRKMLCGDCYSHAIQQGQKKADDMKRMTTGTNK